MGIALAAKRTAAHFTPALRRWVANHVMSVFYWLLGLTTGLLIAGADVDTVMAVQLGGMAILWVLRLWSGTTPPVMG